MSRRKQQRPTHIVDEDTQEGYFSENDSPNEELLNNSSHKNENLPSNLAAFYSSTESDIRAANQNGNSQESFSDSEIDGTSVRTHIGSEHDLYEFFTNPSRKRRKYIRGGDKVCMVCGKVTKSPSDLERHIRVHTGERPFQCVICYKPFKCKRSQQSHQYICHNLPDGLSESRIALLELHKKHRAAMFTKLRKELSDDKIEYYNDNINAAVLQNSISQLEKLLNRKDYHNNINPNCLAMSFDYLKHSNIDNNILDNGAVSSKQNNADCDFPSLDKEAIPLHNICKWNNESNNFNSDEKEPGEKSYLCELCGQDFSSFVHFNSHHQTKHKNDTNSQNGISKSHPDILFKSSQVNSDNIASSFDNRSSHEMQICSDEELEKKRHPPYSVDEESEKTYFANQCQENRFNDQIDAHPHEQQTGPLHSPEPKLQYPGIPNSLPFSTSPVAPDTYLLTSSGTSKGDNSLSWHNIKIQSEKVLITRLEGVNSTTDQNYILYKCCLCGSSFPGLDILCSHLAAHSQYNKEHGCEKCGAVFKWRSQLDVHEQVHQVIEDKLSFLPNYTFSNPLNDTLCHTNQFFLQSPLPSLPLPHQFMPSQIPLLACNSPLSSPLLRTMLQQTAEENKSFTPDDNSSFDRLTEAKRMNMKQGDPLQCKYCPKTFDRIFSLQRHERIHTGVKPCCCKICGRGFSERRNLRHHMIRFHSDNTQRDLLRRGRHPCYQRSNNSSLRLISFLKRTAVRILNSIDQTKFDDPSAVANSEHLETNCNEEQQTELNETSECDHNSALREISDNENVTVVIPTDVSDSDDRSDDCVIDSVHSVFENKEVLKDPKHSLIGSRRKGRPYKFNPMHGSMEGIENKLIQESISEQQENYFSPADIDYLFQELNVLNFEGDGTFPATKIEQFSTTEKLTGKAQESQSATVQDHGAFFSSCSPSYYDKNIYSTSDVNRNMNFHEDARPYKCSYCNYYSRTNSQLKVHTMRHQGIKQFLCQTCNYNGVTQSDLNRHCKTRTHLLRARNVCFWCKLGFYTPMLLEEHIRSFHQNDAVGTEDVLKQETESSLQSPETNLQHPSKDLGTSSPDSELLPQNSITATKQINVFENNNYLLNTENRVTEVNCKPSQNC